MKVIDEEELINSEEIVEEKKEEEINNNKPEIAPAKYTRPPAFQKAGNFSKGNFQTNNNRQRPGRAAGRGR